jgi:hypothetical protein
VITFAEAKAIVRAAEESIWTVGTYQIEDEGWEGATHYLVVRGAAEAVGDNPDPNFIIVPGLVPLVDKQTGEIEYVVAHLPEVVERLDAMTAVRPSYRESVSVYGKGWRSCCRFGRAQLRWSSEATDPCTRWHFRLARSLQRLRRRSLVVLRRASTSGFDHLERLDRAACATSQKGMANRAFSHG